MKVISLINMKGGVAKTTMAVNISHCLSTREKKKVLMIDVDPQFNATQCVFGSDEYVEYLKKGGDSILNVFEDETTIVANTVEGIQSKTAKDFKDITPYKVNDNWYVLPGNLNLYKLEMASGSGKEYGIKQYIDEIQNTFQFDYVIIDTPPTPSVWMTSALIASDYYLIPVKPDPLSYTGIELLDGIVKTRKKRFNLNIKCIGIVFTMVEHGTLVYQGAMNFIQQSKMANLKFKKDMTKHTVIARGITDKKYILDCGGEDSKSELTMIVKELMNRIDEDEKKVTNINEFINILEEISWIIDRKSINLSEMIKKLRVNVSDINCNGNEDSVTHLVGILPSLFMDKELFVKNDDLLDFAEQILKLKAKRGGNRSRTESIGWIVCELSKSDETIRQDLIDALDELVGSEEKKSSLKKKRQMPNFSWNEAIAKLNDESI